MKVHIKRFREAPGRHPVIDMTPDGEFREGQPDWVAPSPTPWADRLLRYALVITVLGGMVVLASLAIWLALVMIPVVAAAALIGYAAYRWRLHKESQGR